MCFGVSAGFPLQRLENKLKAPVNGDTPPAEGLSENDSGVELTNENSPLTAAEPPSPFSPKQNGDAASPQDDNQCSRGSKKRGRKKSEEEEATWDSYSECAGGPRPAVVVSGRVPEAPRLELMEQDSKDSAQSISTSSSSEIQPESTTFAPAASTHDVALT
ncbi:hypothetical protein D9C73_010591 [Collichthys lucidus]|uniref:Uncharacterized protein n=1 Tax=Collichthys lucidus TaxID=240159 RepID=A0A4V6XYN7_COLLU|nr:hypothetical protein D9C73_010591 [Collichthys lucidus]